MQTPPRWAPLAGAALILSGCASTYDRGLLEQRSQAYAGRSEVSESASGREEHAAAGPALPERADLAAYVEHALARNADLRAAFERWRATTERVEQVSTLPDPRLSYGEFLEEVQTRTGPQQRRIGLSQSFPWPGQLDAQARVAGRHAEAAWHAVEQERLRVVRDVEVAYHEFAFLGRELGVTGELLGILRGLEPIVQGRVRVGAGQGDLLRLQVEIGRLEDELASIERRRPMVSARLADAMTLGAGAASLPVPELAEPSVESVDLAAAHERALAANPRLAELAEELAARRGSEELVKFRRRPGLTLGLDYIQTGDALNPSTPGSGDDPLVLGVTLTLPVWTSSYASAEREARHLVRVARQRIEATESGLRADVEEQAYRAGDAARRIRLFRDSLIPRATEALDLTLTSYRAGAASVLDLIDSERALLEFELSFWRACRDYLQSRARLRALTGGGAR